MRPDVALATGQAYAWGREDASGVLTRSAPGNGNTPSWEFGKAYAQGWADYDAERRGSMPTVRDAYRQWQESGGAGIFRRGDSTAECQARAAAYRAEKLREECQARAAAYRAEKLRESGTGQRGN